MEMHSNRNKNMRKMNDELITVDRNQEKKVILWNEFCLQRSQSLVYFCSICVRIYNNFQKPSTKRLILFYFIY